MPIDPRRVKALFNAVLDRENPAERASFLDLECGDDAELRGRINELLLAYLSPASALERPIAAPPFADQETLAATAGGEADSNRTKTLPITSPTPLLGRVIAGRYKLRQEIGEGGMGSVYLAEQTQPVKRQVALKLIKSGMDSRTVLARFESERQALALMDHPNIARVLDAGTTEEGRPFFVMELVKGIPLTDYCDQHRLDLPTRLALFRQICSAVQHAHQKGIIHRDLKPTNILVESHDGKPVPKVIDFGLAKATSGMQLSEHSLFTAFGSVTGTPLYMAPEQATFNALDVDTRADIYALGVILYELLTGSTPIQRDTMKRAALDEMLRVIREDEPPTPSSRISTSGSLPSLAASRHVEPGRLSRLVKGDLDWIVMKALAKERDRRYESAIGLSNDVERFLNHEPVSAGPPTAAYRMRKFVRRHRGQVVAAALVLLALVGGVVGTTLGLIEARRQQRIALAEAVAKENARLGESKQRKAAEEQRRMAERRLGQVAKMNGILGSIFRGLNVKESEAEGKPLVKLLGERLEKAAAEVEGEATGDPLVVATMQTALGVSLHSLNYSAKAIEVLERARSTRAKRLGPAHPDTIQTVKELAWAYLGDQKPEAAIRLRAEVLAALKDRLGADHPETLQAMDDSALTFFLSKRSKSALPLLEECLARRRKTLGLTHPMTIATMGRLAQLHTRLGTGEQTVLPLMEEALAAARASLGPTHVQTMENLGFLTGFHLRAGRVSIALPLLEEQLAGYRSIHGPDHHLTLLAVSQLAYARRQLKDYDRAIVLYEEALAGYRKKFAVDGPDTLEVLGSLGITLSWAGKYERAVPLLEEYMTLKRKELGSDAPRQVGLVTDALIKSYKSTNHLDRILELREEVVAARKARPGSDPIGLIRDLAGLSNDAAAAGRPDRAAQAMDEALELCRANADSADLNITTEMYNCGVGLLKQGRIDRAIVALEEALALEKRRRGADYPGSCRNVLANAYLQSGQPDRAVSLLDESLVIFDKARGPEHPDAIANRRLVAQYFETARRYDRALTIHRDLAALHERRADADPSAYATSLTLLGFDLVLEKQWFEAETALRKALAIRDVKEPDAWSTFNTRSLLGAALLGQGKATEAEPLLRSGYEGMANRAAKIPPTRKPRLAEALDRLIAFGETTGKADEVKAWKEERAKMEDEKAPKRAEEKK